MLPGFESPQGKIAYIAVGSLVLLFSTCSLLRTVTRNGSKATYSAICDKCGLEEERELPLGGGDLPLGCERCGEKAVWLSRECPYCTKRIPFDPKSPPKRCRHCGKRLSKFWR